MSQFKREILKLAETTVLTNKEIAKVVGCSDKTVLKYAGSYVSRAQRKANMDKDSWKIKKAILLPDIHYPCYNVKAMDSVNNFIIDYKPNDIIYMGDQLNLDCISVFNKRKPLLRENQRLYQDYKNFDNDILKVHESITSIETNRVFMIGNHEYRVVRYIEEHPELDGLINIEIRLNLIERGYHIVPYNEIYKIGKLNIIHGFYYSKYHATKTLEAFGGNVVYAHVHNPQMFCKISPIDQKEYHMSTSLPCLSIIKPAYKKNVPNFWVSGFGLCEYVLATGYYNLYPIIINEGKFFWNGKQYG